MTITSILLAWTSEDDISKPILNSKAFFLKVIYDTSEDFVVISTACKCLEEIEIFYPGILKSEVKDIIAACERHTSPAFQSYSLLVCAIIRNMICAKNLSNKKILQDSDVNTVSWINCGFNFYLNGLNLKYEEDCGEEIHIFSVVSYLLDLLPLMTYTAAYKMLKDLICIVKNSSELLPTVSLHSF
ncbi:AP-5 complex subunit beta-1-like isoform X1 [Stegodyphus dumicola]|uniref:AP-5 complex subunit beta-1-like isoform X1 n=1 Tax=Stegodyphus dumicola TaxID=202533 RepID=UPI0015A83657|nr:AP-5 complex subunit beta-1-like isoform X1 [Stegodyphus dumicola]